MPAIKTCPSCSHPIEIDRNQIGEAVTCPNCGKAMTVKKRDDGSISSLPGAAGSNLADALPTADTVKLPETVPPTEKWQDQVKLIAVTILALLRTGIAELARIWKAGQKAAQERKQKQLAEKSTAAPTAQPTSVASSWS